MNQVPVLQDEINRKAFETIEDLLHLHSIAKISDAQLSTGIDTLFKAVNGLVDEGVNTIITEASKLLPLAPQTLRYAYLKGTAVIALNWIVGDDKVTVVAHNSGAVVEAKTHDADNALEAKKYLQKTRKALSARGYQLL